MADLLASIRLAEPLLMVLTAPPCNESSLLFYVVGALQNLVSEIVLATSGVVNDPDNILSLLSSKYGVTIVQNKEDEPLGTGM